MNQVDLHHTRFIFFVLYPDVNLLSIFHAEFPAKKTIKMQKMNFAMQKNSFFTSAIQIGCLFMQFATEMPHL